MQPHQLARASPITHSTLQLERLFLTVPLTCWELMSLSGRKQSTFVISYLLGLHLAECDTDCDALTGSRTPAPAALLGLMMFSLVPAALLFPIFIGVGTKTSLERLVSRFVYPVVWGCWSYSIFLPSDHTFSIWSVFRWKSSRYFNSSSITLHITNWSFPFVRRTIRNPEEGVAMKTASLWQCCHFVRWQIKQKTFNAILSKLSVFLPLLLSAFQTVFWRPLPWLKDDAQTPEWWRNGFKQQSHHRGEIKSHFSPLGSSLLINFRDLNDWRLP